MAINTLGRYKIIREIARSNDVVYEAVDTSINRRLALKELLLPPNLAGAQKRERIERFYREARAAGSLTHPNIVTIFEAGEDHGRHFIAMEFLEGQTLRQVLDMEGTLNPDRAVEITKQVCSALSYAHSKGVVHRDIKPDNIQILPSGIVKITDFGIARLMDEPTLTADGQVFGTPSYMSPEQVAGKNIDARSDIFSLGIVLFEMLAGRKPFSGDSVVTITYNIMNQDVIIPPSVPQYLERVILRCLAKDPNQRFSSVAEMSSQLEPGNWVASPYPYQSDPMNTTQVSSVPPPFYGQMSGQTPQPQIPPPPPLQDPFAGLKPGDLSLPKDPLIKISSETVYFIKVMTVVMLIVGFLVGFVWMLNSAYQGYQNQSEEGIAMRHVQLGTQYFNQHSYQSAIQEFTLALNATRTPQSQQSLKRNISDCYLEWGNTQYDSHGVDSAVAYWEQALQSDSTSEKARESVAWAYLTKGNIARQNNDTNGAIQWWTKAKDVGPGTPSGQQAISQLQGVLLTMPDGSSMDDYD